MASASKPQSADEKKASATARLWIAELEASEKWAAEYIKRAKRIVQRYKNDVFYTDQTLAPEQRRYAILWSNVQTLGPAVYARTPSAVVSRRFRDPDPVGKLAAEVLERAIGFSLDQYDFDERMNLSRDNYLLVGRGQVWARYVPHVAQAQPLKPEVAPAQDQEVQVTDSKTGEGAADTITYQEVLCDYVPYSDWGYGACRFWDETPYVWRRVYMTRVELVERFGDQIGQAVPLDWAPKDDPNFEGDTDERSRVKKAAVYEIWDKPSGKVYWINKSYPASALDQRDDPLSLTDFFPCPRPLMATTPPDEYIPIPDYIFYQDQAEELDELTQRIGTLTDALRMVGVYAAEDGNILSTMFQGKNNQVIPVPSMASLQDKGGLKGIIEWLPIDMVISTLKGCFESRQQILDDIYQITGISDILRGDSQPSETATAQGIKAQWGSLRVRDRQKDVQRFARDIIRLKAEIIGKHFTVETLKAMTGVKLLTNAEKQQVQQIQQQFQLQTQLWQHGAQIAQQSGQPPQPQPQQPPVLQNKDIQDQMGKPSWDDVNALLKDNAMRSFKVDVETDSTIEPNENEEKQRRVEFVTAIGQLLAAAMPLVQQVPALAPLVGESVKFLARGFRVSGEMEDVIEKTFEQLQAMAPQPPPGQKNQQQQGTSPQDVQLKQMELQGKQAETQAKLQQTQSAHQLEAQSLAVQQQQAQQQAQIDQADLQLRARDQQIAIGDQHLKAFALQRDPKPQGTA